MGKGAVHAEATQGYEADFPASAIFGAVVSVPSTAFIVGALLLASSSRSLGACCKRHGLRPSRCASHPEAMSRGSNCSKTFETTLIEGMPNLRTFIEDNKTILENLTKGRPGA
jgi:hypothetical protein